MINDEGETVDLYIPRKWYSPQLYAIPTKHRQDSSALRIVLWLCHRCSTAKYFRHADVAFPKLY